MSGNHYLVWWGTSISIKVALFLDISTKMSTWTVELTKQSLPSQNMWKTVTMKRHQAHYKLEDNLNSGESRTIYSRPTIQLSHFPLTCLRRLFKVKWQNKNSCTRMSWSRDLHTTWENSGHIMGMDDIPFPKTLLYVCSKPIKGIHLIGKQKCNKNL